MPIERITGVIVGGNICLDIPVWPVDKLHWGTTTWVETVTESVGGNGANTAYALATLGVPVKLIGVVGADDAGRKLLASLAQSGVDVARISLSELPTTTTVALVQSSGERLFLHRPGSSGDVDPNAVTFEEVAGFSHFHFGNPFALPLARMETDTILERARAAGLTTSLDTGWDARGRWIEDIGPCLPFADILFLNESEARMLTGQEELDRAVAALRSAGAGDIVVKTGAKGCIVYSGEERMPISGFRATVVDTTGAGDCFAGAFLAALSREWTYDRAGHFANAVGALNVQKLGAAQGVLSFEETLAWMRERSKL